jgi:hypothetical protein
MRYVENVTGHGYRFIAPLTRADKAPPARDGQARVVDRPYGIPIEPTHMIGRALGVATPARGFPHRRFVTIVGSVGIGKTSVAMGNANPLNDSYPRGVCFVDLASIANAVLNSGTAASARGVSTVAPDPLLNVIEFLKHKQILIVLDNCEPVI